MGDFNSFPLLEQEQEIVFKMIMIKLESIDPEQSTPEYYLSSPLSVDGNIIPINLNTPLVNELGKNLLKAAAEGDIEEIRQLLTKGAPFTADWLGTSPLHLAAQGNHAEICELLLSAGISPNARTKVDRTPLHMAACEGHMEIVELLLGADADVDCTDLLGMTPLHWASQNGHADIVYVLLKSNAKVDIANKFSLKPVDVAGQIGRLDIVRMLEEQRDFQQHEDPTTAAEYLAMEMAAEDEQSSSPTTSENVQLCSPSSQTMDVLADEDEDTGDATDHDIRLDLSDPHQTANSVSMKILQEHGITMLPNDDDNNILSTVMETGHSVVLTDVGKQMLDCVKASEEAAEAANRKALKTNNNYITVTADELLMMATNASISKNQTQIVRKLNGKYVPKTIKKIVMTRNKLQPISPAPNQILRQKATFQPIQNAAPSASSDRSTASLTGSRSQVAVLTKQLEEAKRTIEEYKLKLLQKEAEVEEYKQQLRLLGYS